ncbi:MAG: hypothetical protein M3Q00_11435 [Pseudomonadota bacterium]|nr:hypothetical protein [Pseudomonadota bacterium]
MATRGLNYLVGVLVAIIVLLAWALMYYARDEIAALDAADEPAKIAGAERIGTNAGIPVVRISKKTQQGSAIVTRPLEAYTLQSRAEIYGSVIGIQPLVELRARYLAAQNGIRVVQASLTRSAAEYQRMQTLYRDKQMVSLRAVQAAESEWKADHAKRAAEENDVANIRAAARQQWGEVMSRYALGGNREFDTWLSGQQLLVQLAWGLDQSAMPPPASIKIAPAGGEEKSVVGQYVSPAMQADAEVAGRTFWYRAPGMGLRVGMRVAAVLEDSASARSGVSIPFTAQVWHAGKAWVYVKRGDETFERREVATGESTGNGWFNGAPFKPGDVVVVSGAQLLLSEEFRYQIKDENDD